jgi:hypothetical protein
MTTARVESVTAQVKTLVVGNRQITLSIAKQLDRVPILEMEPWGRVNLTNEIDAVCVIGKHRETEALVLSCVNEWGEEAHTIPNLEDYNYETGTYRDKTILPLYPPGTTDQMKALPLIVLAGLR